MVLHQIVTYFLQCLNYIFAGNIYTQSDDSVWVALIVVFCCRCQCNVDFILILSYCFTEKARLVQGQARRPEGKRGGGGSMKCDPYYKLFVTFYISWPKRISSSITSIIGFYFPWKQFLNHFICIQWWHFEHQNNFRIYLFINNVCVS